MYSIIIIMIIIIIIIIIVIQYVIYLCTNVIYLCTVCNIRQITAPLLNLHFYKYRAPIVEGSSLSFVFRSVK